MVSDERHGREINAANSMRLPRNHSRPLNTFIASKGDAAVKSSCEHGT